MCMTTCRRLCGTSLWLTPSWSETGRVWRQPQRVDAERLSSEVSPFTLLLPRLRLGLLLTNFVAVSGGYETTGPGSIANFAPDSLATVNLPSPCGPRWACIYVYLAQDAQNGKKPAVLDSRSGKLAKADAPKIRRECPLMCCGDSPSSFTRAQNNLLE